MHVPVMYVRFWRSCVAYMNKQFCRFLVPERELCVDENRVAIKGHSIMKQYIPSKAAKFGIKFWMLCESATGYILQMSVYRGWYSSSTTFKLHILHTLS
jgi:hypothetical protein